MNFNNPPGKDLDAVTLFKVTTSKGLTNKHDSRIVIANSIPEAMEIITPYLEENEDITSVSQVHDITIWVAKEVNADE